MPKRSAATRQLPAKLRNIGPKTLARLAEIGVLNLDDLRTLGAVDAYRRLKFRFPREVSLNALYALEAALLDCHWRDLPAGRKAELKRAVCSLFRKIKDGGLDSDYNSCYSQILFWGAQLGHIDLMDQDYRDIALKALISPFQRWKLFLRCTIVPYTLLVADFVSFGYLNSDEAAQSGSLTTAFVFCFILSFLMLPILCASFLANWRRAIIFEGTGLELSPLLRLDRLTIQTYAHAAGDRSAVQEHLQQGAHSVRTTIIIVVALIVTSYVSNIEVVRVLLPRIDAAFVVIPIYSAFVYFGSGKNWHTASASAINLPDTRATPSIPEPCLRVIFGPIALSTFAVLTACWWFAGTPHLSAPTLENDLAGVVWLAAIFVTIGWSSAAQSLIYRHSMGMPQSSVDVLPKTA